MEMAVYNLVRLRLELLPFNVHLPIGQKQGASQFTLKKLSTQAHNEMRFTVKIGRVGSFHTVPVQIAIAELAEDLESGNLYESQSVKFLREQLQAQEFHIQWIESGTSNEKCLCFELDKEYEDQIPLSVDTGTSLTRITHRGPCSQPIRVGVVNKPSENRHDHWNTVFKKCPPREIIERITSLSVNKVVDRFRDIMLSNLSLWMKIFGGPLLLSAMKRHLSSFQIKFKLRTSVPCLILKAKF